MSDRKELLRAVALGELAPDAPEVLDACRVDPALRVELDELRTMRDALDSAADQSRSIIEEARGADPGVGEERLVALARERLAGLGGAAAETPNEAMELPGSRGPWPALLAAAAVALVSVGLWRSFTGTGVEPVVPDITLGSERLQDLEASYDTVRFTEFSWRSDLEGGWFELRFFDMDGNELATAKVRETNWQPEGEEARGWPKTIEWQVRWIDASGVPSGEVRSIVSSRP